MSPSQQAVVDSLEIAQQTYANYEVARARPAVSMLPILAQLFGVSVDELFWDCIKTAPASVAPHRCCKSRSNG